VLTYSGGGAPSGPGGYGSPVKSPTPTATAAAVLRAGSMVSAATSGPYGGRGATVSPATAMGLYHTAGYHHQGFYAPATGNNGANVTTHHRPSAYHDYTPR
jgi:hypothetical protein